MPRKHKYGESKTTLIMMATVRHVTAWAGCTKYQATWFLLNRRYILHETHGLVCTFVKCKSHCFGTWYRYMHEWSVLSYILYFSRCDVIWFDRQVLSFQGHLLLPSTGQAMVVAGSPKIFCSYLYTIWCHILHDYI